MLNCQRLIQMCLVATFVIATAGIALAENILVNGDFETGDLTGWVVSGISGVSDVTIDGTANGPTAPGTYNAFMDNQAGAMGLTLKQTTEVGSAAPGMVQFSYDLKLDQADAGGVLFVEIFAEQEGVGIVNSSGLMGPYWAWEWTNVAGEFEAAAGTDFFTIQFMANTGANEGTNCIAHVDNVVLDQGTVAEEAGSMDSIKALYR